MTRNGHFQWLRGNTRSPVNVVHKDRNAMYKTIMCHVRQTPLLAQGMQGLQNFFSEESRNPVLNQWTSGNDPLWPQFSRIDSFSTWKPAAQLSVKHSTTQVGDRCTGVGSFSLCLCHLPCPVTCDVHRWRRKITSREITLCVWYLFQLQCG